MDKLGMGRLNVRRREDSGRKENKKEKKKNKKGVIAMTIVMGKISPRANANRCCLHLMVPVGLKGMISFTLFH